MYIVYLNPEYLGSPVICAHKYYNIYIMYNIMYNYNDDITHREVYTEAMNEYVTTGVYL